MTAKAWVGFWITVFLAAFYWLSATTPPAHAAPLCEPRSAAHAAEHGTTVAADSRYHVARGELPTCEAQSQSRDSGSSSSSNGSYSNEDEGKSRYCRKRWFC